MNVQKTNSYNTNFKSGLTFKLIKDIRNINVAATEAEFAKLGIDADFKGKKSVCANFVLTSNILKEISEKYKLPFDINPPAIRTYSDNQLLYKRNTKARGLCPNNTIKLLKDEPPFIGTSILINNKYSGLFTSDFLSNCEGFTNWCSTSHFLSTTLHEWFHCIHDNLTYKLKGYEGSCPVLREKYYKKHAQGLAVIGIKNMFPFPKEDIKVLSNKVGRYAANSNSVLEVFAELMTKITVESLDKELNVVKNPLDNMPKNLPGYIREEVEEVLGL